jgi:hypothetical protein
MTHMVGSRGATDMKEESVPRLLRPFRQRVSCVSLPAFLQPPQHQENEEADQDGFFHTTDDLCRRSVLLSDAEASGRRRHNRENIRSVGRCASRIVVFCWPSMRMQSEGACQIQRWQAVLDSSQQQQLAGLETKVATPLDSTSRAVHHSMRVPTGEYLHVNRFVS